MFPKYNGKVTTSKIGYIECKINSVQDFFDLLKDNNNFHGYQFRGQDLESYKLEPTILRLYSGNRAKVDEYQKHVHEHYKTFLTSLRGRFNESFDANRDKYEIWALGQHYGLATPLLDWTATPWVALYFAFREKRQIIINVNDTKDEMSNKINILSEDRAVYCLNAVKVIEGYYFQLRHYFLECYDQNSMDLPFKTSSEYDNSFVESVRNNKKNGAYDVLNVIDGFIDNIGITDYTKKCCEYAISKVNSYFPTIVSPRKGFNARLVNQRGLFTFSPTPDSLEKEIFTIWSNSDHKAPFPLIKLLIPDVLRDEIIETLYEMNINELSLFPDIHGACQYSNWKLNRKSNL